jgi:hypothetical protein
LISLLEKNYVELMEQGDCCVLHWIKEFTAQNRFIAALERQLQLLACTRLCDWVDHLAFAEGNGRAELLAEQGFTLHHQAADYRYYHHPSGAIPGVALYRTTMLPSLYVRVESVADYLLVRGQSTSIEGGPLTPYRRSSVAVDNGIALWVCERRGSWTLKPAASPEGYLDRYLQARERWRTRPRDWEDEEEALRQALLRAANMQSLVGSATAAALVLEGERDYYQSRNQAAQLQKSRLDHLGLGWASPACHVFASSRAKLATAFQLFELLGFRLLRTLHAGEEAGWGMALFRHPDLRAAVCCKVDLSAQELAQALASRPLLAAQPKLGETGLWCGLHGESLLKAGMQLLAIPLESSQLRSCCQEHGIGIVEESRAVKELLPFTTEPERWPVSARRLRQLVQEGQLTDEAARGLVSDGAAGSVLGGSATG